MKTIMINIKADVKVKKQVQSILEEIGLNLSGVINAFLKNLIRTREVRFTAGNKMTPYLERVIEESRRDLKQGKLGKPMTLEEALDYLDGVCERKKNKSKS
jgi:addiction module RelB/DinJ family antitoxin